MEQYITKLIVAVTNPFDYKIGDDIHLGISPKEPTPYTIGGILMAPDGTYRVVNTANQMIAAVMPNVPVILEFNAEENTTETEE